MRVPALTHTAALQISIKREMRELEGEVASNTDGEVILVFDLRADSALLTKRTARELVNRFQKLRKKAGLLATDTVELFYAPRPSTGAEPQPCCKQLADHATSLFHVHRPFCAAVGAGNRSLEMIR